MSVKPLLDFIGKIEGRNDYNIVWGGIKAKDWPPKHLTTMTIREVLAWQDRIDPRYMSEAAGTYQILEDTLRGLYAEAGLTLDSMFDRDGQDALAVQLLKRRGLKKFLAGQMSVNDFCNSLAKEWASLPLVSGPNVGKSFYGGDGLNKSLVSVKAFTDVVASTRANIPVTPTQDQASAPAAPKPAPVGWWDALVAAIAALFGGKR
jgi:muramidase (phage lysozyme)